MAISNWLPQVIWLGLMLISAVNVSESGSRYDAFQHAAGMLIINVLMYWGGFYG